ncbi:response regulator [Spirochaeta isovalerica]|uniref:CheY-like chemotaxis protein n=1 Tax=Spirochaeta isovalerica TaxID=150 RepID=A0A841RGK7_9SPIO|nr:response regulator [Spirochaeta isovalerica]MBB6482150.1 CheY-like chemotaxis protein [Spirochaeta isovalerica]
MIDVDRAPVLLVEDEEDHARFIVRTITALKGNTHPVIHLKNGKEALDFFIKNSRYQEGMDRLPLFILLDINMPMIDGFEVLEEIKKNETLRMVPVIMLTTTSRAEDIKRALNLGANDFIVKPVSFSDFTDKIRQLALYWGFVSDIKEIFC